LLLVALIVLPHTLVKGLLVGFWFEFRTLFFPFLLWISWDDKHVWFFYDYIEVVGKVKCLMWKWEYNIYYHYCNLTLTKELHQFICKLFASRCELPDYHTHSSFDCRINLWKWYFDIKFGTTMGQYMYEGVIL
jgi:hypothetical protein